MATVVILEGDETGQELLAEALRVLQPGVTGAPLEFVAFDLSLPARRATRNGVVHEAAEALRHHGAGLKAATITPEGKGDVGSPNAILREAIDAQIILRTGRRIPGVRPVTGVVAPIAVVRMAVDDAYGAQEWREGRGTDEVPSARCASAARSAASWPSSPSSTRAGPRPRCLAARSSR